MRSTTDLEYFVAINNYICGNKKYLTTKEMVTDHLGITIRKILFAKINSILKPSKIRLKRGSCKLGRTSIILNGVEDKIGRPDRIREIQPEFIQSLQLNEDLKTAVAALCDRLMIDEAFSSSIIFDKEKNAFARIKFNASFFRNQNEILNKLIEYIKFDTEPETEASKLLSIFIKFESHPILVLPGADEIFYFKIDKISPYWIQNTNFTILARYFTRPDRSILAAEICQQFNMYHSCSSNFYQLENKINTEPLEVITYSRPNFETYAAIPITLEVIETILPAIPALTLEPIPEVLAVERPQAIPLIVEPEPVRPVLRVEPIRDGAPIPVLVV